MIAKLVCKRSRCGCQFGKYARSFALSHSILTIDESRPLAARAISEEHAKLVAKTGGAAALRVTGLTSSDVAKVLGGNMQRVLRQVIG